MFFCEEHWMYLYLLSAADKIINVNSTTIDEI